MKDIIIQRLKEPSTWAGIGALVLAATGVSQELWNAITSLGIALAGVLSIVLAEQNSE